MKKTVMNIKALMMACMFMCATASLAANGIWDGTVDAFWTNSANWSASPYPSGADTATFTNDATGRATMIDVDGLFSIKSIIFDTPSVAAYTNGTGAANSQKLVLADSGVITLTDTAANSQLFNCALQLGSTIATGTYTLTNANTSQTLTFNNVLGAPSDGTAGAKTLVINGAGNTTILGNIQKGGATSLTLTDISSGTCTLAGTNTFSTVNMNGSGILMLPGSNTVTTLNMNGGTNSVVDIGAGFLALSNTGGNVLNCIQGGFINGTGKIWMSTTDGLGGYNYADLNVAAGKTLVINPEITGPGGFETWSGNGTFVLNGINTFAAHIYLAVAGSTISVGKIGNCASIDSNLGKGTNINFNSASTKLIYTGIGETSNRKLLINNSPVILDQSGTNGTLTFSVSPTLSSGGKTLTLQGSNAGIGAFSAPLINSSGTLSILKAGSGTWIFSGTNTYTGTTTVNGGKLLINNPGISTNSIVTVNSGAILGGNSSIYGNVVLAGGMLAPADVGTVGTLRLGGSLVMTNGTLLFDVSNVSTDRVDVVGSLNVNGTNTVVLTFPEGTLVAGTNTVMTFASLTGSGTFVLSPAYVNAFLVTNATSLQLVVSDPGTYAKKWIGNVSGEWNTTELNWTNGSSAVSFDSGDAVLFDDTASNFTVDGASPVLPSSVHVNNSLSNYVVAAAIDGAGEFFKLGSAAVTLTGSNTYTGQTTIASGTLTVGGAGVLGGGNYEMNMINNGTLNFDSSVAQTNSGVISGGGSLTSSGSGTLTLSGNNTYNGPTIVNAGSVLKAISANALGATVGGTLVNAGGTLQLEGNITTLAEALALSGTLSSQTGTNTFAGAVTVSQNGASYDVGTGSLLILSASNVGVGSFSKTGGGWLRFALDPNNTGTMTINEGVAEISNGTTDGDIVINAGGTFIAAAGAVTDGKSVTANSGGIYDFRGADTIFALNGAGLVTKGTPGLSTLSVGGNGSAGSFSGVVEDGIGQIGFTKVGTGTQVLSGTNTYTGATTVNVGILLVNAPGSLAVGSAVTVANGAILGGNGAINGPVTLSAGGNLAPGGVSVIGTLTLGSSLTLNGNALLFDLSNAAQDKVAVDAALTVNGVNTILVNGTVPTGDYPVMTFASTNGVGSFSLAGISNASLELTETNLILHVISSSGGANLTWQGDKSLIWDGGILNWLNGSTPSAFSTGDAVLFDDTALNSTVNSGSAVSPASVLFNNSADVYTINAIIAGATSITKLGTVNANLQGVNTFTGPIIVGEGTLAINTPGQLGSGNYAQDIFINNGATFHYASTANQVLSGVMSGSGNFTKSGSSILILSNANTRTGGTTLSGGTLIAKAFPTALGTGNLTLNNGGNTLELDSDTGLLFNNNATITENAIVKSGRLTSGPAVTNTLGTLSIAAKTLTVSQGASVASGTAGLTFGTTTMTGTPTFDVGTGTLLTLGALGGNYNFTKSGVGTLFFGTAGGRAGGYSTLGAGTLKVGNAAGLGTTGTTNVLNGGILDLAIDATVNAYRTTVGGNTTIQSDKATFNSEGITHTLGPLGIGTFTLTVTNGPNVRVQSPFGLFFSAATLTGNATMDVANNGTGLGTLTLGPVSGNFALTKKNFGLLKLVGTNVYNGATTINNGRVMGVSGASCSNSSFTVQATTLPNANAGLSILCTVTNGQWTCTNLTTLAASSSATAQPALDFLFNVLPSSNTNFAPLRVLNNITFTTNPVVNVYLGNLNVPATNYPLMIVRNTATNVIPTLNMIGGYTNSTLFWTNKILMLKLVGTPLAMKWNPGVTSSGTWDINNSANLVWTNGVAPTYYQEPAGTGVTGDRVVFDDAYLTANSTVTLNSYASPTTMTVSNQLYSYTISGSGAIAGTNSLTKQGTNVLTLATANTFTGNLNVNSGTLVLAGSNALTTAIVNIAGVSGDAIVKMPSGSSLVGSGDTTIGSVNNGNGAFYLSGGQVVRTNTDAEKNFAFGSGTGGYGYFNMSDGTLTSQRIALGIASNVGTALARITGGIATFNNWVLIARAGGIGVMTIDGGSVIQTGTANSLMLGYDNGRGELNMTGGLFDNAGKPLAVRNATGSGSTGIVNVCSGTLIVNSFVNRSTAFLNFNGGLLKAGASSTTFLPTSMTGVYVNGPFGANAGGANIDSAGKDITFAAPLLAPTGNGVTGISLSAKGSGYIGEPYVSITGDGVGATAVANMLDDGTGRGTYMVDSVTITTPGVNYTTATVSFLKGGATAVAPTVGTVSVTPNSSGGLTKIGSGTLTLSAVNTYSGATILNNGKLLMQPGGSCSNSTVTLQPSGSGATAILAVRNNGADVQWTCNGLITSAGTDGATDTPVVEFDFMAIPSATAAPLVVTGTATFNVTPDVKIFLVNLNVPAGAYPLMEVGGTAPTAVPTLTLMGGYSGSSLSWSGNTLMLNIVGTSAPIVWDTGSIGSGIWNINNPANLVWKTDGAVSTYYQEPTAMIGDQVLFADTYITTNTTVTLSANVTPTSVSANNSTYAYTLTGSAIAGTTRLTKSGGAPLTLSSANSYSGGTTIEGGGILSLGNIASLGTGGVTNDGILNIIGGANVTIKGLDVSLSGAGTNNVTLGTFDQSTYLSGNYSAFTGLWNIGLNVANGPARAVMTGLDNSAATINVLSNSTLWVNAAGTHNATLILNGGDTGEPYGQLRIDTGVWAGPITIAGPMTAAVDGHFGSQNQDGTISGLISEQNGPYVITKVGANKTTLTGNNTFKGPLWVKAGTISVPALGSINGGPSPLGAPDDANQGTVKLGYLGTAGGLLYTGTGASTDRMIDLAGTTGGAILDHSGTGALTFSGDMTVSGVGNKMLTLQGWTTGTAEFSGAIANGAGSTVSLTKTGTVTWILSGANTYSGMTAVNGGTLDVSGSLSSSELRISGGTGTKVIARSAAALGVGAVNFASGAITPRLELKIDGGGTIALPNAMNGNSQLVDTIDVDNNGTGTDGVIQFNGHSLFGNATLNVTGTNGYSLFISNFKDSAGGGGTMILNPTTAALGIGTLSGYADGNNAYVIALDGTHAENTITGTISDKSKTGNTTIAITKQNSSTWTLSGASTYSGATTVTGGRLVLAGADGSLSGTSAIAISGGSTLELQGSDVANNTNRLRDASAITLNSGTLYVNNMGGAANYREDAGALFVTNNGGTIATTLADAGMTNSLYLGTLTRTGYATLNFTGEGLGESDQNRIFIANQPNGLIGLWATINTTNYAAYDENLGVILAGSGASFTNILAKGPSIIPDDPTLNAWINEEGTEGGITLEAAVTNRIKTLVQNTDWLATVAMTNQTLLVNEVLVSTGNARSLTLGTTVGEGAIAPLSAGGELLLTAAATNSLLTINAAVSNNTTASRVTVMGPGTVVLAGTNSFTGALTVSKGTLNLAASSSNTIGVGTVNGSSLLAINGPTSLGANNLTVGNVNGDRGRAIFSTNASMNKLYVGTSGALGSIIQNGGALSVGPTVGGQDVLSLGLGGGYGYYQMNSGSLTTGQIGLPGSVAGTSANNAVFDLFNGAVDITSGTGWLVFGWTSGNGVLNLFNGSLITPSGQDASMAFAANGNSFGMINMLGSGARLDVTGKGTTRPLNLAKDVGNKASVLNLKAGECVANRIAVTVATTPSYVNFDGGTLKANVATTTYLQGLTAATVYPGGAIIDSTNVNITVAQSLLAPTDYGVASVNMTSGGAGYIGAPVVMISGGSGTNATAIATVDLNPASEFYGQVTSIEVTSPGVRYQPGDVLTVTCLGGGCTAQAIATATLGLNSSSGGLTKLGSGTLTLSGTNTYAGATTISSGTLRLGVANALPTNSVVNVNGGIYDLNGFTVTNGEVNVTTGSIVNGKFPASSITVDGYATIYAGVNGNDGLTKNGNGTLVLKGAAGNFPAGPLVVNGGTLTLVTVPPTNGLSYWLDAADTSKLTLANTNVTAWADSSTNGVTFTNSTAANQPVYVTNVINGLPAVRFNGTTQKLGASKAVNAQTVFIVNTPRSTVNLDGIWGISGDIGIRVAGATSWQYPGNNGDFATAGGQMFINGISNSTFAASMPHLLTAVSATQRTGWTTSIGQYYSNQRWFKGDIGEVLVYGSTLSTDDRFSVEAYLKSKWFGVPNNTGLTVSLADNTILDLAGGSLTLANLAGSGTVSNGTLTVTGEISPAGTNVIGTLTAKVNTTLSGKLVVDVDTDGNGDKLVVEGDLTLASPTLEIQNLQGLSTIRVYTLVTCSGTLSGTFNATNLPDPRWVLRYTTDNKVQLYYKSGTMVRIM